MSAAPSFQVVTGPDPWPVTLKLAAHLRRVAEARRGPELPSGIQTVCFQADRDDRVVTIRRGADLVQLSEGATANPGLTMAVSFNQPFDSRRQRVIGRETSDPKLERLIRGLLLLPDVSWSDTAMTFWERHGKQPHMPDGLIVSSGAQSLQLGSDTGRTFAVSGDARALADLFAGRAQLTALLVRGALFADGTWEAINAVNAASQNEGLGSPQAETL